MHDNKGRKTRWNVYPMILCGLVFFVFAATIFCMAVDSSEAKREAKEERIQKEQLAKAEEQKKEAEEVKAQEEEARKESFSIRKLFILHLTTALPKTHSRSLTFWISTEQRRLSS